MAYEPCHEYNDARVSCKIQEQSMEVAESLGQRGAERKKKKE